MKSLIIVLLCICTQVAAQVAIVVDPSKQYQSIHGFGAFGGIRAYWEPPPFYTQAFLDYFIADLGSTIVRTNIFWDLEPQNDNASSANLDLSKFNYKAGSNLAKQLPYYRALKDAGVKKIIATSWTPPEWMKLHDDPSRTPDQCYNCNNCPVGDSRRKVCGGRLDPKFYGEYAEYLLAYTLILKQEADIDLYAISIQNEPWFPNPFESNVVKPEEYAKLLNAVGSKFRSAGLSTRIFGPEHMAEWSWGVQQSYVSNLFPGNADNQYLDIYAVHGYVDGVSPDFGSAEGWTALKNNISDAYDKPLWMTETSGYPQTFEGALNLAKSMYLALRFGEISAWVYWSISGEPGSEYALMANGEPTVLYYISKQFYRYVRPGSTRIECAGDDAAVLPLGFQNPGEGSMTLVLVNTATEEKSVELVVPGGPDEFSIFRTSSTENSVAAGTIERNLILPPQSVTTLVGYGTASPSMDDVPDYYVSAGDDTAIEIPLTGIDMGDGSGLQLSVSSSNESVVPVPELSYNYPSTEGTLTLHPNTGMSGESLITITLDHGVNPSGFGFRTISVSFRVVVTEVVTGVKKKVETDLVVYPNPLYDDFLTVELPPDSRFHAFVVKDIYGRTIFRRANSAPESNSFVVDARGWPTGFYFLEAMNGRQRLVEKIVVR